LKNEQKSTSDIIRGKKHLLDVPEMVARFIIGE